MLYCSKMCRVLEIWALYQKGLLLDRLCLLSGIWESLVTLIPDVERHSSSHSSKMLRQQNPRGLCTMFGYATIDGIGIKGFRSCWRLSASFAIAWTTCNKSGSTAALKRVI